MSTYTEQVLQWLGAWIVLGLALRPVVGTVTRSGRQHDHH